MENLGLDRAKVQVFDSDIRFSRSPEHVQHTEIYLSSHRSFPSRGQTLVHSKFSDLEDGIQPRPSEVHSTRRKDNIQLMCT